MEYHEMLVTLATQLRPARLRHCRDVSRTAVRLAERWGVDVEKARMAGMLHDCARNFKGAELFSVAIEYGLTPNAIEKAQTALLHAPLGAILAQQIYGVSDPEILQAIRCHTTGMARMTPLDKVIYLADYIEPGRKSIGVQPVRELAEKNLNAALLAAYDNTLLYIVAGGGLLHPDTVEGRNWLLMEMKEKRHGK